MQPPDTRKNLGGRTAERARAPQMSCGTGTAGGRGAGGATIGLSVSINLLLQLNFLFENNDRHTCNCQKQYGEVPGPCSLLVPNGHILLNDSKASEAGRTGMWLHLPTSVFWFPGSEFRFEHCPGGVRGTPGDVSARADANTGLAFGDRVGGRASYMGSTPYST